MADARTALGNPLSSRRHAHDSSNADNRRQGIRCGDRRRQTTGQDRVLSTETRRKGLARDLRRRIGAGSPPTCICGRREGRSSSGTSGAGLHHGRRRGHLPRRGRSPMEEHHVQLRMEHERCVGHADRPKAFLFGTVAGATGESRRCTAHTAEPEQDTGARNRAGVIEGDGRAAGGDGSRYEVGAAARRRRVCTPHPGVERRAFRARGGPREPGQANGPKRQRA